VGRHIVQALLDRGHEVTLFHRGTGGDDPFPEAEHRHGDRNGDLAAAAAEVEAVLTELAADGDRDAFTAAVVAGLLAGRPLPTIAGHALRVASFVCSQAGATPLIPPELLRPAD